MKQNEFLSNLSSMTPEQQEYALRGIPFHLATIGEWEDLQIVLTNLDFIQEKVMRGMSFNVIGDYQFAATQLTEVQDCEHIKYVIGEFARAFNQEFINFQQHPELTIQQIFNNLYSYYGFEDSIGQRLKAFFDKGIYTYKAIWLRQYNTTPKTSIPRELLRTLSGHTGAVRTVCISRDGSKIITGGIDGKICVWKWEDGSILTSFNAHPEGVIAIDWYSDNTDEKRIVSIGNDQSIRVWDSSLGEKLREWDTGIEGINSLVVASSTNHVYICSDDGIIRVWDLETGQEAHQLRGHWGRILCLSTGSKDSMMVSGGEDLTLRVWRLQPLTNSERLYGHMDIIRTVAIEPNGKWVVSAGDDTTLRIWELGANKNPITLQGHSQSIRCIALTVNENGHPLIVSGSDDETIKIWSKQTGTLIRTLKANKYGVNAVAFDPFNRYFVSAGEDGTIIIWNANIMPIEDSWVEHDDRILSIVSTQKQVASAGADGTVRLWNGENGTHYFNLRGHYEAVNDVTIVGNKIFSCGQDGLIKTYDLDAGKFLGNLNQTLGRQLVGFQKEEIAQLPRNTSGHGHIGSINCLCPISDRAIISGGSDGTARLWNIETGQEILTFQGASSGIEKLVFSRKHLAVIATGTGRDISLWSTQTKIQASYLRGHTSSITSLCLTQEEVLVSSSRDGTIRLWDIPTRSEVKRFSGHEHWVLCARAWGEKIFSGGDDKTIRVWDMPSGKEVNKLNGHADAVRLIVIDPDTERLFSCGEDRRLNVWGLGDGSLQASIYTNSVISHLVVIDRRTLCAGSQSGRVVFLSLEINE